MPVTGAFGLTASFTDSAEASLRGVMELKAGAQTADIVAVYIHPRICSDSATAPLGHIRNRN